jgi:hypothetical protein
MRECYIYLDHLKNLTEQIFLNQVEQEYISEIDN